jgi:hypothetical protein
VRQRFERTAKRLGFNAKRQLFRTDLFRPPSPAGQGSLF